MAGHGAALPGRLERGGCCGGPQAVRAWRPAMIIAAVRHARVSLTAWAIWKQECRSSEHRGDTVLFGWQAQPQQAARRLIAGARSIPYPRRLERAPWAFRGLYTGKLIYVFRRAIHHTLRGNMQ